MPHLEITEIVLVHYNIFNNNYQQSSRILYTQVPNKLFGQLLIISPKIIIKYKIYKNSELKVFLKKTFNSEFLYI